MFFKPALIAASVIATAALTSTSAQRGLPLDGDWRIEVIMADGVPTPAAALRSSVAAINDGRITFHLPQPSVFDNVQLRFEFVEDGLNAYTTVAQDESAKPMKGTWALTPEVFQFCYATDDDASRPELQAGDGIIYIQLKRIRESDR